MPVEIKKINFQEDVSFVHNEHDIAQVDANNRMLFVVLFRRLSNADFLTLLKLFALYTNCVVSFVGRREAETKPKNSSTSASPFSASWKRSCAEPSKRSWKTAKTRVARSIRFRSNTT